MKTLTATYRIVTPMFLGGADPTSQAELRVPSIKGALRFWWRALMWGKVNSVEELRRREAELFGSSGKEGQSKAIIRLELHNPPSPIPVGALLSRDGSHSVKEREPVVEDGARYLGYGLMEAFSNVKRNTQAGQLIRSCLPAPFEFSLHIHFKSTIDAVQEQEFVAALKLFGLCGGIGSRSRRGFGSVSLTSLIYNGTEIWAAPANASEWEAAFRNICKAFPEKGGLPKWTSLAKGESKILLLPEASTSPLQYLAQIGRDFVFFRSAGRWNSQKNRREVFGQSAEPNFLDDHDLMAAVINSRRTPTTHPARIAFGLPQNYFFSSKNNKGSVTPAKHDRRASSLIFHIHQAAPTNPPLGVLIFLPSQFLPSGEDGISVNGKTVPLAHNGTGEFWQPVHAFLERLQKGNGKEKFHDARLVEL